jgi:hypothetical protein
MVRTSFLHQCRIPVLASAHPRPRHHLHHPITSAISSTKVIVNATHSTTTKASHFRTTPSRQLRQVLSLVELTIQIHYLPNHQLVQQSSSSVPIQEVR